MVRRPAENRYEGGTEMIVREDMFDWKSLDFFERTALDGWTPLR
jgi:hypothetical protein